MKMFRLPVCIILACLFLSGCKKEHKPEFKTVLEQSFSGLHKKTARYSAYVVFTNSGKNSFTVDNLVADLVVDGKDAATVVYNGEMAIQPKSEFKVPVKQSFDPDDVFDPGDDGSYPKAVKADLQGELMLINKEGQRIGVSFEYSESVNLNIKKDLKKEKKTEKTSWRERRKEKTGKTE